ncbi:ubiquitin-associated protein 1-like isoform X2 [Saccostrea echinata]|uniref:ubiquitin-associated protein 1-like isoform X2 n=1 Tax=Saccostrea echinata TaxID=191078 RepID=UPI002A810FB1|nr:ubiquitin-associated protein 1-like isoform X2 [Saccostrea echinata]
MDRTFQRQDSVAYSSSHSSLDGIPFKIGPNFTQKHKVISPRDFKNLTRAHAVEEEYDFSLEEGVLKWADERQKQLAAQQRAEEERRVRAQQEADDKSSDSDQSEHEYENDGWQNNKVISPPAAVTQAPTRPVLPAISNDILTPVDVSCQNDSSNQTNSDSQKPVDFSLFETEDDPFDRFERLTLNDLTELKSVFDNSGNAKDTTGGSKKQETVYENTKILNNPPNGVVTSSSSVNSVTDKEDGGNYVELDITKKPERPNGNVKNKIVRKQKTYKGKVIPPVPPRPSLAAKSPLPPIGIGANDSSAPSGTGKSTNPFKQDETDGSHEKPVCKSEFQSNTYENVSVMSDQQSVSFSKAPTFGIVNDTDGSLQSTNPFLPTNQQPKETSSKNSKAYVNVAPVKPFGVPQPRLTSSLPDPSSNQSQDLPLPLTISPPPRPSSKQSWNRYSPLPQPAQPGFRTGSPSSLTSGSTTDLKMVVNVDPYNNLPPDSKRIVDSVVGMGFSKAGAARAVEKLGADEKEVIEYLCVVGKFTDKGHEVHRVEEALFLFKNNQEKIERFLALFKQFQELGFLDHRIKEELVKNDLDSDKTLDSLTA